MKGTRTFALPPGVGDDSDSGSEDEEGSMKGSSKSLTGSKPLLVRRNTFYDVDYEGVKVSTVPQTQEGWSFFMDLLKVEHRKFKLLLTNLRIERGKILKEMELFSNTFAEAKHHIQEQFSTSMFNLRAVNVARLLNGEINKRTSSFIKTAAPIKSATIKKPKSPPAGSMGNLYSALSSVREAFGVEDDDGEEGESTKAGAASEKDHVPRPSISIELDISEKVEVLIVKSLISIEFNII